MAKEKITAILIIEVAGRPPEYLKNSLEIHVDKFKSLKGVELLNSRIHEPKLLEEQKDIYTMFAEVEINTETLGRLIEVIFEFMPSSVTVVEPADLVLDTQEASMVLNDLAGRLHKYDDLAKIAKFHIKDLSERLQKYEPAQRSTETKTKKKQAKKKK